MPRRHEADFGRATRRRRRGRPPRRSARSSARLAASLDGPPYNLVLHTAPLREQVDATYHWHWEIHPRLREIAGLELGTGLPVNPVSPEDAVEELLGRAERRGERGRHGLSGVGPAPTASHRGEVRRLWADERAPPIDRAPCPIPARSLVVVDPSLADLRDTLGRADARRSRRAAP